MRHRLVLVVVMLGVLVAGTPRAASADLTAFVGATRTQSTRPAAGVALSVSLLIVAFEFEYADTREDVSGDAPGLRTGMFNIQLHTPNVGGVRLYGTVGGGLFQQRGRGGRETSVGGNAGGGLLIPIAGPIGARLDYRVFMLRGDARHTNPQRGYVGINLAF